MTCCCSNQKNSTMSTILSMMLASSTSIGGTYPRSTKRYKEWKAEAAQVAENADKQLAPEEDVKKAKEMIQRLKDCGLYDKRFAGGKFQVEFNVDLDGVPLKGFLDCLRDG